jgi:hypothetical protein
VGAIEVEESRSPIGAWESERGLSETTLRHHAGGEFDLGRRNGRRMSFDQAIQLALEKDEQEPA